MISRASASNLSVSGHGYPRPQLVRDQWWCLNGKWEFAFDKQGLWRDPEEVAWKHQIVVPFAPEVSASGIGDTGFYQAFWYRRQFDAPPLQPGQRLVLHFGAVDYEARVWVNGVPVAAHVGGYTPFYCDVTDVLRPSGPQTVVVCAQDDPHDLTKPRGKQDWQLNPHVIWYPRTSGIWQTVWMEVVPAARIGNLNWKADADRWEIDFQCRLDGEHHQEMRLRVRLTIGNNLLADDDYLVIAGEVHRRIALSDPGIDDYRNEILWYPTTPTLIQAELELRERDGHAVDWVRSYTAMRTVSVQGDCLVLNGRPHSLRMVLDQGYWPDTGLSSPDDAALRRDVELAKAMGFNGVRRHQHISDPRYLYWADRLGLMVWEEMPSAYRFTPPSIERLTREWTEVIRRDISHPCIVAWVPFNESWGVPDLPGSPAQRHYVQALYHLTKTLDRSRPVVGNDGWESVATDIIGIHDYDDQPESIARRYGGEDDAAQRLFRRERPGGRILSLDHEAHADQPIMLTEFGGISLAQRDDGGWGYSEVEDAEILAERYERLLETVRGSRMLAGYCYTQFADTYQETNGLLYADRTPKFPIERIAVATAGAKAAHDVRTEQVWRERMMNAQWQQYAVPVGEHQTDPHR